MAAKACRALSAAKRTGCTTLEVKSYRSVRISKEEIILESPGRLQMVGRAHPTNGVLVSSRLCRVGSAHHYQTEFVVTWPMETSGCGEIYPASEQPEQVIIELGYGIDFFRHFQKYRGRLRRQNCKG